MHRYIYQAPEASSLEELISQFKENTGFLLVRHPLVRLVSAYEDKMLNPHPFPYAYHHRQRQNQFDTNLTATSGFRRRSSQVEVEERWRLTILRICSRANGYGIC